MEGEEDATEEVSLDCISDGRCRRCLWPLVGLSEFREVNIISWNAYMASAKEHYGYKELSQLELQNEFGQLDPEMMMKTIVGIFETHADGVGDLIDSDSEEEFGEHASWVRSKPHWIANTPAFRSHAEH